MSKISQNPKSAGVCAIATLSLCSLTLVACNPLNQSQPRSQFVAAIQPEQFTRSELEGSHRVAQTPSKNIAPQFDSAADFSEGLALVGFEQTYGFINKAGKVMVKPDLPLNGMSSFAEGRAVVRIENGYALIDQKGQLLTDTQYERNRQIFQRVGSGAGQSQVWLYR
ncbi:WG repeat-containing protein [Kovacikia minuta CCNUW1]|uniref:WG repeat-containing protein n=1 Tax=Kovacikia minuta TaxID=2931930 RepID=UPI001CCC2E28|nr:WG repeat-containing protein [Kovacikia minuta]UBF23840.1 WG repeat-containing protein [Kovacikia minuta CCNUW1]